jgi:hypothetical protein
MGIYQPTDRHIGELSETSANQFWDNAAARAQPRGDRRNESRHNRFI